jgi:3-hexulose-6-phosphate synthase/6-phospho-3-hexuloisomerase
VAGGINSETAAAACQAGADVIIVGGAITKAIDPKKATQDVLQAMRSGQAVPSQHFKRTDLKHLREALEAVRTSNVSDGAHRMPCLEGLHALQRDAAICGPAVTVQTVAGDWSKPVQAIDAAKVGDVLVIDAGGTPPAVWGELASESAKNKGIAGLICFGAVRDSAQIRQLGFPVWSRHVTSHAGDPHGVGRINRTIRIAGRQICPGDWILADDDGVMVLPKAQAVELANRAADVLEAENRIRQEIRDNQSTLAQVVHLKRWDEKDATDALG